LCDTNTINHFIGTLPRQRVWAKSVLKKFVKVCPPCHNVFLVNIFALHYNSGEAIGIYLALLLLFMKHVLVITHAGSGGTLLCRILSTNHRVRSIGRTGVVYDHPMTLKRVRGKIDNVIGPNNREGNDLYVDKLLFNYEFYCKPLYQVCKFIYMIREPQIPLASLIQRKYTARGAEEYYLFRLRRICEMARHTTGAVLLTYEDLVSKRAFPLLQNALNLKSPLSEQFSPLNFDDRNLQSGKILQEPVEPIATVPEDVLKRCKSGYLRYLTFLKARTGLIHL
jgi:hypothetical protein